MTIETLKRPARLTWLGLAAAAALCACQTTTNTTTTVTPAATTTAVAGEVATKTVAASNDLDPDRRVCKRQSVVGSKFLKKVCMSARQWEEAEEAARDATANIQKDRSGSQGRG